MNININISEFAKTFDNIYTWLYKFGNDDEIRSGAKAFDEFLPKNKDFVGKFNKYRHDIIISDREAAAFMFALEELRA